jgi:glycosyltransferase XagB
MHGTVGERLAGGQANPGASLARARDAGQPVRGSAIAASQYTFLLQAGLSPATLAIVDGDARRAGVAVHDALLASGALTCTAYAAALAAWLRVPVAGWEASVDIDPPAGRAVSHEHPLGGRLNGRPCIFVCAESGVPEQISARIDALRMQGLTVALSFRARLEAALESTVKPARLDDAVKGLYRHEPAWSAAGLIWTRQVVAAVIILGLIIGGAYVDLDLTLVAVCSLAAIPFLFVTLLRIAALREILGGWTLRPEDRSFKPEPLATHTLPVYSVLVPLLREAGVLPGLVQALQALIYPSAKLEVLLVLEASDVETQAALLHTRLPGNFRAVIVPDGAPQTKPKALNYALQYASGAYIVVYDAEDRPEPDQLLRAVTAFERLPPDVGCLQAQLNIYNPNRSWFTRQFTIEYSALFDAILPALARLRLPVPLGGTSNHFRREALIGSGAWDPYNVTEDADLGLRLVRRGWRTGVLASTTWEEAPVAFGQWLRQRTRWLKGWMQTYLVHTRQPLRLNREIGLRAALGLHVLMGALLLSALVHPIFYVVMIYLAVQGNLFAPWETLLGAVFWAIAWTNLSAGYFTSITIGVLSVRRRGRPELAFSALFMPLAWLLISVAAYRALYQLARTPFLWEKTEHGK